MPPQGWHVATNLMKDSSSDATFHTYYSVCSLVYALGNQFITPHPLLQVHHHKHGALLNQYPLRLPPLTPHRIPKPSYSRRIHHIDQRKCQLSSQVTMLISQVQELLHYKQHHSSSLSTSHVTPTTGPASLRTTSAKNLESLQAIIAQAAKLLQQQ